jgi:hypothetical protein
LKTRILLAGLVAALAMAFSASSALAVTVRPAGTHTATSVGSITLQATGFRATCEKSSFQVVVGTDGSIKGGGPSTFSCTSTLGPGSIYLAPVQPEFVFGASGMTMTLRNVLFHLAFNVCSFNVTGYESTTIPGVSPLSFSDFGFSIPPRDLSTATMKVTRFESLEKGCLGSVHLNDPVALGAKYEFTPPLIVTQ